MSTREEGHVSSLAVRGSLGGVLMGLANLVPGISGGTMLLATGVYTRFIEAVAEVTTFRFRPRSLMTLAFVGIAAVAAIALLAGPVKHLVETQRWVMYSLFIGLTLGGVPLVWRRGRPATGSLWAGTAVGFGVMALLAFLQPAGADGHNQLLLVIAGAAGASAMILPGVSGAYLLLVLGQYEAILGAVDQLKRGLGGEEGLAGESFKVLAPVAIGVAAGIVGVSNLVRWALDRHEQPTLGVLLGLLFGSVLGIYPFQEAVERGEPRIFFTPSLQQVLAAAGLVVVGLSITLLIDRLGNES